MFFHDGVAHHLELRAVAAGDGPAHRLGGGGARRVRAAGRVAPRQILRRQAAGEPGTRAGQTIPVTSHNAF